MARHLFIVARHDPYLADYLRERFSGESNVQVLLDRRRAERRRTDSATVPDRRRGQRRSRPEADDDLRLKSHAFVTLP